MEKTFWKWMFRSVSVRWFCCCKQCKCHLQKFYHLPLHLSLETEFSNLLQNFPSNKFEWVLNIFVKNKDVQYFPIGLENSTFPKWKTCSYKSNIKTKFFEFWWVGLENGQHDLVNTGSNESFFGSTNFWGDFFNDVHH